MAVWAGGLVQLWDAARGRPLGNPLPIQGTDTNRLIASRANQVVFSPDGGILASGGADGIVRLWDVAHRHPLGPARAGHLSGVNAVAFSPDDTLLASTGGDRTVRLWDVARHRALGSPLIGHADIALSVAFSADGRILASGSTAPSVWLWDVAVGQPLGAQLSTGRVGFVDSLACAASGTTLVAGSNDGAALLWDVGLAAWPRRACGIASRNLTLQEWRQYLGDQPYHTTCPGLPAGI